jgi:hypothetical protein
MKDLISEYVIPNLLAVTLKGIIASPRFIKTSVPKNFKVLSWCDAELIKYIQQDACNKFLNIGLEYISLYKIKYPLF